MTDPNPKPVFFVIPRPHRGLLLDHIIRHGITAPDQPAPHTSPPRYDPPPTIKQDPR